MRSLVLTALILAVLPVTAGGVVAGTESPLAPQPIVNGSLGSSLLSIGASPSGFLLVWYDGGVRGGPLLGKRLSPDGETLDATPFVLSSSTLNAAPRIAWNGTDYLVTTRPYSFALTDAEAWLVSPGGEVRALAAPPQTRNARGETIDVEYRFDTGLSTFFAVGGDGTRRALGVLQTSNKPFVQLAVPNGDDWGLLAAEAGRVRWLTLDAHGVANSYVFDAKWFETRIVSIAVHGDEIAFGWRSGGTQGTEGGYSVIDTHTGVFKVNESLSPYAEMTSVAYDGDELMVAWIEREGGEGTSGAIKLRSGGRTHVLGTFSGAQRVVGLSLASGARNALVWNVQQVASSCCAQSFIRTFDRAVDLQEDRAPEPLVRIPAAQLDPRAVSGPAGLLTVWREYGPIPRLLGRFGAETFAVSGPNELITHAVAATADTYAVVWSEFDYAYSPFARVSEMRVLLRRYDASGKALDAEPRLVARETGNLANPRAEPMKIAVIGGDSFVIAWIGAERHLYVKRVAARGTEMSAAIRISTKTAMTGPVLVRLGGRITVIHDYQAGLTARKGIDAVRLSDDLVPDASEMLQDITRFGPANSLLDGSIADRNPFDAAVSGNELLLAWPERGFAPVIGYCLYTRRFTAAGLLAVEPPHQHVCNVTLPSNDNDRTYVPSVAHDGKAWWFTATGYLSDQPMNAWRLAADGSSEPPIALVSADRNPSGGTLVRTNVGLFAFYSRSAETPSPRAFVRPFVPDARGRAVRH
jgi:hypothetical protein